MTTLITAYSLNAEDSTIISLHLADGDVPVIDNSTPYIFINPGLWFDEGPKVEYPTEFGGPVEDFVDGETAKSIWQSSGRRKEFLSEIQKTAQMLTMVLANGNQLQVFKPDFTTVTTPESFVFYPETPIDISTVKNAWCLLEVFIPESADTMEFRLTIGNYVGLVESVEVATEMIQHLMYMSGKIEKLSP